MDTKVETFIAFTGCPADQAAMFIEMSGGDVETAVEIYMSSQDGGGGDFGGPAPMDQDDAVAAALAAGGGGGGGGAGGQPSVPWWSVLWPSVEAPPEAWTQQRLDGGAAGVKLGISQPKNGPCGVLAVVHGLLLAEQHTRNVGDVEFSPEATARTLHTILARCRPEPGAPLRLVRPKVGGDYRPEAQLEVEEFADPAAAEAEVMARIDGFRGPGGIIDLVYSAVLTRGVDLVTREALSEGGELPLVPKMFNCWLCSMELMSLLMRGTANGNCGAFSADGSRNSGWDGFNTIGMLSRKEKEQGIPMNEALKSPRVPVWILHGGDHFTVAWAQAPPPDEAGARFVLHHWNGLPPGGPRLAEMAVHAVKGAIVGAEEKPKHYKPEPGEIDEVVQAEPEDKKAFPGQYRQWRYEVLLARDRADEQYEARGPEVPPEPRFEQEDPRYQREGAWRCRLCYEKRFQTMDFALVPADSPDFCQKCSKPRKECGWSLWLAFADLPAKRQATVMDQHAKKIEPILWTRWPAAEIVDAAGGALPDC